MTEYTRFSSLEDWFSTAERRNYRVICKGLKLHALQRTEAGLVPVGSFDTDTHWGHLPQAAASGC